MHSVNQVTVAEKLPGVSRGISSTEKRKRTFERKALLTAIATKTTVGNQEVRLWTKGYKTFRTHAGISLAVDGAGERIESVVGVNPSMWISDRKDKRKAVGAPLLIAANSSRMLSFADPQHSEKIAADDRLMVRGAESAAGGLDVI
ncbi:MAG: hypothetical protein AAFV59_12165 [Pseudomonadota bacterium]